MCSTPAPMAFLGSVLLPFLWMALESSPLGNCLYSADCHDGGRFGHQIFADLNTIANQGYQADSSNFIRAGETKSYASNARRSAQRPDGLHSAVRVACCTLGRPRRVANRPIAFWRMTDKFILGQANF